jgi:hypothetical protein
VTNTINAAKAEAVRDIRAQLESVKRETSGAYRNLEDVRKKEI